MNVVLPAWRSSAAAASAPGLLPGESTPPDCTVRSAPSKPLPPSVPPLPTVTAEVVRLPFTRSVPADTVVPPL